MSRIGVGIVGSGFVTQAIHLPVLAASADIFEVRRIVDVDPVVSGHVAASCGAVGSTDFNDILNDPAIDVVAICSPDRFHAEQLVAACAAGKKAVLCEKPLAINMDLAVSIRDAVAASETALFVGTMHAFDPAYRAGLRAWHATGDTPIHVRSAIYLPRNEEFIDQATEVVRPPAAPAPAAPPPSADHARNMMRRAMLGLAIHDLPLIRNFQPEVGELVSGDFLHPFGYALVASNGSCVTELTAVMPGAWPPKWTFEVTGRTHRLAVTMPPSFVMSGAAEVVIEGPAGSQTFTGDTNGYQALWQAIAQTVRGEAPPPFSVDTVISDLKFALDLADGADILLGAAA